MEIIMAMIHFVPIDAVIIMKHVWIFAELLANLLEITEIRVLCTICPHNIKKSAGIFEKK